jgi:hypothetical protein
MSLGTIPLSSEDQDPEFEWQFLLATTDIHWSCTFNAPVAMLQPCTWLCRNWLSMNDWSYSPLLTSSWSGLGLVVTVAVGLVGLAVAVVGPGPLKGNPNREAPCGKLPGSWWRTWFAIPQISNFKPDTYCKTYSEYLLSNFDEMSATISNRWPVRWLEGW